jgi:hypothetical protein
MLAAGIAVTVRDVDAAGAAMPVDVLVPGETTTCLFQPAEPLGRYSPKLTRKILYSKP